MFTKNAWLQVAFIDLRLFDVDPIPNVNRTTDAVPGNDLSPEMKTYYEKRLIQLAEAKLIHDQWADKYPIPKNGGKTIEFRRYSPLAKAMTPLTEGVTPTGNRLNVSKLTAEIDQYGDWIGLSDVLQLTTIDNNVVQSTKILSSQAGRTLDTVTREVLAGGTSKRLAPHSNGTAVDLREDITSDCKVTPELIFKAAADLKAVDAEDFNGSYASIVHPYVAYDLMRNPEWIDVSKYKDPEKIYNGELGKIGSVRFFESSEAKIIGPGTISGEYCRLTVKTAISESTTSVVVDEVLESATPSTPIPVYVGGVENTVVAITKGTAQSTLTLGTAVSTLAKGAMICGTGAGKDGSAVFVTLVLGAHAYGTTELEEGGLQHIFKPNGSAGTADPLNQRASVGWKAFKTAERLVEAYMIRIESGSAYSMIAKSN